MDGAGVISVTVKFPAPAPTPQPVPTIPPGVVELRRYGDPIMVDTMLLSLPKMAPNNPDFSNFQNIVFWTPQGHFGAVGSYQPMDSDALQLLYDIQPGDDTQKKRVMDWMGVQWAGVTGHPAGRPYMYKGSTPRNLWGTMGYGGQKLLVETDASGNKVEYVFNAQYQNHTYKEDITFYKVLGLRRSQIADVRAGKITHASHPWLIQQCTAAFNKNTIPPQYDIYTDHPRGDTMYNPVWSPLDWPSNFGSDLYLAKAFTL